MFSNTDNADVQVLNHTDANELANFAKVICCAAGKTFCAFYTDLLLIVSVADCSKQPFLVW